MFGASRTPEINRRSEDLLEAVPQRSYQSETASCGETSMGGSERLMENDGTSFPRTTFLGNSGAHHGSLEQENAIPSAVARSI